MMYSTIRNIDAASIEKVELLARRARLFQLKAGLTHSEQTTSADGSLLAFPSLTWVVQNFWQDQLAGETATQWIARILVVVAESRQIGSASLTAQSGGVGVSVKQIGAPAGAVVHDDASLHAGHQQSTISAIFKSIDAVTMDMPTMSRADLRDLGSVNMATLTSEYARDIDTLWQTIEAAVERAQPEARMTGGQLFTYISVLVDAVRRLPQRRARAAGRLAALARSLPSPSASHAAVAHPPSLPLSRLAPSLPPQANSGKMGQIPSLWVLYVKQQIRDATDTAERLFKSHLAMSACGPEGGRKQSEHTNAVVASAAIGSDGAVARSGDETAGAAKKAKARQSSGGPVNAATFAKCTAQAAAVTNKNIEQLLFGLAASTVANAKKTIEERVSALVKKEQGEHHTKIQDFARKRAREHVRAGVSEINGIKTPVATKAIERTAKDAFAQTMKAYKKDVSAYEEATDKPATELVSDKLNLAKRAKLEENRKKLQKIINGARTASLAAYDAVFTKRDYGNTATCSTNAESASIEKMATTEGTAKFATLSDLCKTETEFPTWRRDASNALGVRFKSEWKPKNDACVRKIVDAAVKRITKDFATRRSPDVKVIEATFPQFNKKVVADQIKPLKAKMLAEYANAAGGRFRGEGHASVKAGENKLRKAFARVTKQIEEDNEKQIKELVQVRVCLSSANSQPIVNKSA